MNKKRPVIAVASLLLLLLISPSIAFGLPPMLLQLQQKAYDQSLPLDTRLAAIKELTGFPLNKKTTYHICVWDPIGRAGPMYARIKDQKPIFIKLGIRPNLIAHSNEQEIVKRLESGYCDAAFVTGFRALMLNKFTGSLDSITGILNLDDADQVYRLMSDPRNAPNMTDGKFTILGLMPNGLLNLFVNDREIDSIEAVAGKRFAVLDFDPMMTEMVTGIGAIPVASDLSTALHHFNKNVVDMVPAAMITYDIWELKEGLGDEGGIIDFPMLFSSMQLIGANNKFPPTVAQIIRESFYQSFDDVRRFIETETRKIPQKYFVSVPQEEQLRFQRLMKELHTTLIKDGYYDKRTMRLLQKVRCRTDASRLECGELSTQR